MQLLSFDILRTFDFPGVTHLKPEAWLRERQRLVAADWLLYPEYWQVNALVYGFGCATFPSISSYHLGHDKVEMTRAFEAVAPAHTPHTAILPATSAAVEEVLDTFAFPFVAKSVRSARGEGVYRIDDREGLQRYVDGHEVLYVQELLPIQRDLRVVWVGDRVVSAYWRQAPEGGFHNNVARGGQVDFNRVPEDALALVQQVARALGIDHAGFDVAVVDGHCFLLEFNVRFGTQALRQQGLSLAAPILHYLTQTSAAHTSGALRAPATGYA